MTYKQYKCFPHCCGGCKIQDLAQAALVSSESLLPGLQMAPVCSVFTRQKGWRISQALFRRRQWHPTPVLLPGKSHGWRSLVGCSPQGRYESDTTERPHFHFSLSRVGEGNGNPLQCSCLENPKDAEA